MIIRCDAPTTGDVVGRGDAIAGPGGIGAGVLVPSGGNLDALPMPLGSLSTLGLAGPAGMPLIAELPAPADPAGGTSCAIATLCAFGLGATIKLPSNRVSTAAEWQDIEKLRGRKSNDYVRRLFPLGSRQSSGGRHRIANQH